MDSILELLEKNFSNNSLETDYKAEVFAHNLIQYYKEVNHIYINRLGANHRSIGKEIVQVKGQLYDLGELAITINVNRDGIYDYLPEGFFHSLSFGEAKENTNTIIKKIQKQKEVEKNSRKFFQLFEIETFYLSLKLQIIEREFDNLGKSDMLLNKIKELWPLLTKIDKNSARIFIHMLSFFHRVKGNEDSVKKFMSAFLNIPIKIDFLPHKTDLTQMYYSVNLNKIDLGVSSVLCGSHISGEKNWVITYGPIPEEEVSRYVLGTPLRDLLHAFYDFYFPAYQDIEEKFIVEKSSDSFRLNTQNQSRLGFSTFL